METFENEGVCVRSVENCLLCGRRGQPLYTGLRDRLETPGVWSLFRCRNCSLVWLNPMPLPEIIGKLCETYQWQTCPNITPTLDSSLEPRKSFRRDLSRAILATKFGYKQVLPSGAWGYLGRFVALVPLLRDLFASSVMFLKREYGSSLLDVGCGSGAFLAEMQNLGWEVAGVEPDPESARVAREQYGLNVRVGTLEDANLPPESQDVITMFHVIEHLPDPSATLKQAYALLRPGGLLVTVTPNVNSLGHRHFRSCWRGLDPPRHLIIFGSASLRRLTESAGFHIRLIRTQTRMCRFIYITSAGDQSHTTFIWPNVPKLVSAGSWAFWLIEEVLRLASFPAGEELFILAMKPKKNSGAET